MNLDILIENVMNAVAAGVIIGCIYGLMCVGLGLIFGVMKVINFAQGELLMLGMYVSLYLFSDWGLLAFLGPYVGPFVSAMLAGPIVFVGGMLLHRFLIAHVSGMRTTGSSSANSRQSARSIATLGGASDPSGRAKAFAVMFAQKSQLNTLIGTDVIKRA